MALDLPTTSGTPSGNAQNINVSVNTNSDSMINLANAPTINPMQASGHVPSALGQTVVSNTGGGALAVTAYFLNEDAYNATPTNNGSGASSVAITYADGWAGKGYNNLAKSDNGGLGIMTYGFTLEYVTTSGGAQNGSGLTSANASYQISNLVGAYQAPIGVPLNAGLRNTIYQIGTMTVLKNAYMGSLSQFSYNVPVGNTVTFTMLTTPQA